MGVFHKKIILQRWFECGLTTVGEKRFQTVHRCKNRICLFCTQKINYISIKLIHFLYNF